jgi:hypothetical protein
MDVQANEIQGGYKWLAIAGGLAVVLSCFLFWVDDVVMRAAPERDAAHAAQMRELRAAQAGLPARVTDDRQKLPLTIEQQDHAVRSGSAADSHDHSAHSH